MKRLLLFVFLLLTVFSAPVFADIVWPSLYIASGMASIKVIIVGLVIELFFVKFFTNTNWPKAGVITLTMNAISCLLGIVLIPISGLFAELMPFNTFHWTHWLMSYFLAIVINTLTEGFIIKSVLKLKFKIIILWLFIANAVSILICILFYGLQLGMKM